MFIRVVEACGGSRQLRAALLALLAVFWLGAGVASAQDVSPSERTQLLARKAQLFQKMLQNPADLDTTFAYADVSAKLGDNEAAVSALERMLLFNPNLPRVQLELGALYFRMGSYQIARTYFDKVMAANPPPEVKQRVASYLSQITQQGSPQQFSGYFFMGGQWQSDANLAPGSPLVASPIGEVLLNQQFVKAPDANFYATTSGIYSYDLGDQAGDRLEVTGTGFANRYGQFTRLDLGLVESTVGPRFNFTNPLPDVGSATLKPYAIANDVSLGGNQYFHTFGAGGEATGLAWNDFHLKALFEYRDKNFDSAPDRPLSRGLTGSDKLFSAFLSHPITATPQSDLTFEFDFLDQDTRLAYYTNKTYSGSAAYRIRYSDPTGRFIRFPMETTIFGSVSGSDYAGPDPCCVPSTVRADTHWRFGLTQSFQVLDNISIVIQAQRDILASNLGIYAYTSNSVLVGPQIRF